jgi:hypothetical protein
MYFEVEIQCFVIRVYWTGKTPVDWSSLSATVVSGGDCPQNIIDLAKRHSMGLAWKEARKRNASKDQLDLFANA